ncbi:MAG: hypothetical protein AAB804_00880 [Patescibacteria group bacterium]
MGSHHHKTAIFGPVRSEVVLAFLFSVVALLLWSSFSISSRTAFISPEVKFTDASASGLQIVPASCPSDPHYAGECTTPSDCPLGQAWNGSACVATTAPTCGASFNPGGGPANTESTYSWSTTNADYFTTDLWSGNWGASGSIPGGARTGSTLTVTGTAHRSSDGATGTCSATLYVCSADQVWNGSACVSICPVGYTLQSGQCVFTGCPSGYVLQGGQCVLTSCPLGYTLRSGQCVFTGCPSGYVLQGDQCVQQIQQCTGVCSGSNLVNSCTGALIQACAYGCSSGACNGVPAPSILIWNVRPVLVKSGTPVQVTWAAEGVQSCTVRGTNGDGSGDNATGLWNTASGDEPTSPILAQTIYTITCQGFPGSSPASVTRSTTVNIIPIFEER